MTSKQMTFDKPQVRQRGRASLNFLRQLIEARRPLHAQIDEDLDRAGVSEETVPDDLDDAHQYLDAILEDSDAFGALNLVSEWHSRNYGAITTEVFEEIQSELTPVLKDLEKGNSRLHRNPKLRPPKYWSGVYFHRTEGGWDGHESMGYIHGEFVHKHLIGKLSPAGIFKPREDVARMAPKDEYRRILDMGCSSGHYTMQLAKVYPSAKIVGNDLSVPMMEYAVQSANHAGLAIDFYQCAAEKTPFEDDSFDLVTSYILLHEMPSRAIRAMLKEAFRLLEKGGDLVMADVPRYADLDKISVWKTDRDAKFGGEPHWRASASLDLAKLCEKVGFVNVSASGVYPHVLIASKPK